MNEITKLASIFSNGFLMLSRKIDALTNAVRMQKPQSPSNISMEIPTIKIPDFPPYPEIKMPDVNTTGIEKAIKEGLGNNKYPTFNVPKADAPIVNVPAPIVNVSPTPVEFPKEMEVKGIKEIKEGIETIVNREEKNHFDGISLSKPLPIMVMDNKGKQITSFGGEFSAPSTVGLRVGTTLVSSTNPLPVADGFQLDVYDYISLSYTGDNLTGVVFKTGGSSGTTVATLTLAYSGSNLTSVTKS